MALRNTLFELIILYYPFRHITHDLSGRPLGEPMATPFIFLVNPGASSYFSLNFNSPTLLSFAIPLSLFRPLLAFLKIIKAAILRRCKN
jgi:hypothetical protein